MKRWPWVRRYGPVLVALLIFVVSLGVSLAKLIRGQQALLQMQQENIYWAASQGEIELLRLIAQLGLFERGGANLDSVLERFDILWSRIGLLREGDVGKRLAEVANARAAIVLAAQILEAEDAFVQKLDTAPAEKIAQLQTRLLTLREPLRNLTLGTLFHEKQRYGDIRARMYASRWGALLGVFGSLISGVLFVALLIRSNKRNRFLSRRNHQFATAIANTNAAVALCEDQDGIDKITYCNERFEQLLDKSFVSLQGKSLHDIVRRIDSSNLLPKRSRCIIGMLPESEQSRPIIPTPGCLLFLLCQRASLVPRDSSLDKSSTPGKG